MMQALTNRQHAHPGHWEGAWVPRGDWGGSHWRPAAGERDALFMQRWSCCMCTNPYSHFCKPSCGCVNTTARFCSGVPTPYPVHDIL
jgi:hypothetical protein